MSDLEFQCPIYINISNRKEKRCYVSWNLTWSCYLVDEDMLFLRLHEPGMKKENRYVHDVCFLVSKVSPKNFYITV